MFEITSLPPELLAEIFKYVEDDYKTLYSCILVNKQLHNIIIPTLWKDPFACENSIKILINCILEEDKDFLTRNFIELTFELLEKPPLYNYVRFCTMLFDHDDDVQCLIKTEALNLAQILQNKLGNFILDHSAGIRWFSTNCMDYSFLINHHRFDKSLQNLYELDCFGSDSGELFDKLMKICKNIQSLKIHYESNNSSDEKIYKLAQLIKAQNQIKYLTLSTLEQTIPDELKKAILTHSQSIIFYGSYHNGYIFHNLSLSTFKNLKTLELTSYINSKMINWKNLSLPNIESVRLYVSSEPFLSGFSDFIDINGKNLKNLDVDGHLNLNDCGFLRRLFQSISQYCKNLESLSIIYNDELKQGLMGVINNCIKLKSIRFINFSSKIDFDKILTALNETLPKNLKSIIFICDVYNINNHSFDILMKNWRGHKPLTMKFDYYDEGDALRKTLKKYQDLGFLN